MTLVLRSFSLAFLGWHLGLLFPGLGEPAFQAAAAVAGLYGGAVVRTLRGWIALPLGALVFVIIRTLLTNLPTAVAGSTPSGLDTLPLWMDRQIVLSLLPFALGWIEGWAFTNRPQLRGWERLVHAGAVTALFWSQGPYQVTLYPHPLALALVFGVFLASEGVLLADHLPRRRSWAAALAVLVLGVGVLWSLLGRYEDQSTAAGGGLMKPDLFQFDFAPLIRLEQEITLGDHLVLLYREEGPAQSRYLRRLVLDSYDADKGFSLSQGKPPIVGRRTQTLPFSGKTEGRVEVRQEYYLVNLDPSSLLGLNEPTTVVPYAQWNRSSFVNAYRVDSWVAEEGLWLSDAAVDDGLTAEQRAFYTRGGDDPEIRALAQSMTAGAVTPFEKAHAILMALKQNYYYSLRPGNPGERGPLKHFLFEGKKGYCSYFAFSMTLLLRSLGIPARIAVGFATDPNEAVLGFHPVRAFQAHAWVEVPLGPYGWIEFDPTSETPAPGEPFRFPQGYDPKDLSRMIAEILEAQPTPLDEADLDSEGPSLLETWDQIWKTGVSSLPYLMILALVAANEGWRHRWRWARWWARDDRSRVAVLRKELIWRARRAGFGPHAAETPEAWARRMGDTEFGLLEMATDISRARYARDWPSGQLAAVVARSRALMRRWDRTRPMVHRLLGLVFPWWPR